jgi:hypothetical protein
MARYLSLMLSVLLLLTAGGEPVNAQTSKAEKLRRKVVEGGVNKILTVKLNSGEKLKGRSAEIKFDILAIQMMEQGKIVTREVRWDEMNNVSLVSKDEKARKIGGFIAIGVLATLAIVIGVALTDPNF